MDNEVYIFLLAFLAGILIGIRGTVIYYRCREKTVTRTKVEKLQKRLHDAEVAKTAFEAESLKKGYF